ncbi:MAG: 4-hydroxy-3-methylbut-2-enyl diphosphate reductase [Bacteroidales bacterium]
MEIEIDKYAGFCFGVVKAIQKAEAYLESRDKLYCLGEIVHNEAEQDRLGKKGLVTITRDEFNQLKNTTVLIRAHGEPPETYQIAIKNNLHLIDATCPVVLSLQNVIQNDWDEHRDDDTQVVIYGREKHAEVIGLAGQTGFNAIIVEKPGDIEKIDFSKKVHIYAQTTVDPLHYQEIIKKIKDGYRELNRDPENQIIIKESICRQVSRRKPQLRKFSTTHEVILFISGKNSSNGKMLFNVCLENNPRSYMVNNVNEIQKHWFNGISTVGISGANSTPGWMLEEAKEIIHGLK